MSETPEASYTLPPQISFTNVVRSATFDRSFRTKAMTGTWVLGIFIALASSQHPERIIWALMVPAVLLVHRWMKLNNDLSEEHRRNEQAHFEELQRKARVDDLMRYQECIDRHLSTLSVRYNQTRRLDVYGNMDDQRWQKEVELFIRTCFVKPESNESWKRFKNSWKWEAFRDLTNERVSEAAAYYADRPQASVEGMSGHDFEKYCASLLVKFGWAVKLTTASRDSGADIIAEKNSVRVAVQTKRYAKPVGNKAVQEAYTSMGIYKSPVAQW